MKKTILLAALLLAAPVLAQGYPGDDFDYPQDEQVRDYAPPDQGPTLDDFRNDGELSWNGEWIDTPEYGAVWRPTRVDDGWQPYMYGRWAWTNAGWAWVSDEPFGWAVYHYGRWAMEPSGWVWVPGRVWAPAWVAWRWGDGYTAWCPLGPRSVVYRQPAQWVFVEPRHFLEPVRHHLMPRPLSVPRPMSVGPGPRAGPSVPVVERATGRTVRPLAVTDTSSPHAAQVSPGGVGFYRPRTAPVAAPVPRQRTEGQGAAQPGPHAAPQHPTYSGGVPAPRQGGQARPQAAPQVQPAPAPTKPHVEEKSKHEQTTPHAKERD